MRGKATQQPIATQPITSNPSSPTSAAAANATANAAGNAIANVGAAVGGDPFAAGATGSRLDQGQDLTSSVFKSPGSGTVVYSTSSDPGWKGGGYVAIKLDQQPAGLASDVVYFAEGLLPMVKVGDKVSAGQPIATPIANPYNGIVGNIEWGLANPSSPGQPLAQVVSDPAAVVLAFYNWARSLGAPAATSTSSAGHA